MKRERRRAISRRLGPIGMSLLASALTAAGFAAFSIADSGGGNDSGGGGGATTQVAPAPPGAVGAVAFGPRLSTEDRQKMEEFRQCMEDNGAPAPPQINPGDGPPKPPSAADMDKIQKAHEACKDKLPERLQNMGPPRFEHCGPPPGAPQQGDRSGQNQNRSNESGTQSSGSSS